MSKNSHRAVGRLGHPAPPSKARRGGRRLAREDGVAITEFALVLPLLMLILLATLDFGKAFNYWLDETDIVHQGVRFAAVNRNPATGAGLGTGSGSTLFQNYLRGTADTTELANGSGSSTTGPLQIRVCFPNGQVVGQPVVVEAKTTYHFLPFFGSELSIFTRELTSKATMRIEQAPSLDPTASNHYSC